MKVIEVNSTPLMTAEVYGKSYGYIYIYEFMVNNHVISCYIQNMISKKMIPHHELSR
jgi:hypothetical protein